MNLNGLVQRIKEIAESDMDWEDKFDSAFKYFASTIRPYLNKNGIQFDYYDPDTTYEADVMALVYALEELVESNADTHKDGPESDEAYRKRLVECDGIGSYWSEDIGNASGEELDAIGRIFKCPRQ